MMCEKKGNRSFKTSEVVISTGTAVGPHNLYRQLAQWKDRCKHSQLRPIQAIHKAISPFRFASVEMTR